MRIWPRVSGVAYRASSVPRSHSRAMTSAVISVPSSVMMTVIEPGMRNQRLSALALNQ